LENRDFQNPKIQFLLDIQNHPWKSRTKAQRHLMLGVCLSLFNLLLNFLDPPRQSRIGGAKLSAKRREANCDGTLSAKSIQGNVA
jgi:hypothetical protein